MFDYFVYESKKQEAERKKEEKIETDKKEARARIFGPNFKRKPRAPPAQSTITDPFADIPKPIALKSSLQKQTDPSLDMFGGSGKTSQGIKPTNTKTELMVKMSRMRHQINENAKEHQKNFSSPMYSELVGSSQQNRNTQ